MSPSVNSSNVHVHVCIWLPYFEITLMRLQMDRLFQCSTLFNPSISRLAVELLLEWVEINEFLWSITSNLRMHHTFYCIHGPRDIHRFNCRKINAWNEVQSEIALNAEHSFDVHELRATVAITQAWWQARQSEWLCHWLWLPHNITSLTLYLCQH